MPETTNFYDHNKIEEKWLSIWENDKLFQDTLSSSANKKIENKEYLLFAFAYPSGLGLHVGHVESKTALDIRARFLRMKGKDVFFPVGWDAFGLPAENYAVKTGIHPAITTKNAINTFRRQIKRLGISYDWENELATSHPEYYKWTQWIFLQLFKKGLAFQDEGMVNWCPSCQTVLANEQVVNGNCERCDSNVVQKKLKQWFFKITNYRDELLESLDALDWPEPTKQQQRNWIGKKTGISIEYEIQGLDEKVECFTTRPDTNFGATFIVLAPEHKLAKKVAEENKDIKAYLEKASKKSELERQAEGRKKTGIFTGYFAINNLNNKKMPIWISDFVLGGFGTGAVVGVPGHDKRDFQFAQEFDLEVIRVVVGDDGDTSPILEEKQVQEDNGVMINSEFLNGLNIHDATVKIMDYLEKKGWGKRVTSYKMRDWLISRQRYWGAPIPIVYDPEGKPHPVKQEHLPWLLPTDVDFKPTGESPLRSSKEFIERTEKLYGKGWKPEFDTMDTFVDSSWYYLRYLDSRNTSEFATKKRLNQWLPIDLYLIGPEHIVLHLLYSRFFTKFLRDEGYLKIDEPFIKMRHQGMILGPDGKKMSKSKGNVINPDVIIKKYGADTLRLYEMFMGPLEADKPWDDGAVAGVNRFLKRVNRLVSQSIENRTEKTGSSLRIKLHQTIKKVGDDIEVLKFNTAIASMMEFINIWEKNNSLSIVEIRMFIKVLAPFAPFLAEELWHQVNPDVIKSIHLESWPEYLPNLIKANSIFVPIQVDGKVRGQLELTKQGDELSKEEIMIKAKDQVGVAKWLEKRKIVNETYVSDRIISFGTVSLD